MENTITRNEGVLKVERASINSITVYEVTEEELNSLEAGNQSLAVSSNFSFFTISSMLTIGITILTANIDKEILPYFQIGFYALGLLSMYTLFQFLIQYKKKQKTIEIIRSRKKKPEMISHDDESVQRKDFDESDSSSNV